MTNSKDPKHDNTSHKIMDSLDNDVSTKDTEATIDVTPHDILGSFDPDNSIETSINIEELHQQIATLQQQLLAAEERSKKAEDQNLRLQAEMQNAQRRASQDVSNAHKFSIDRFAQELIPVIDSLEQALDSIQDDSNMAKGVREGVELTLKLFISVLEKFNLKRLDPLNEMFNPTFHEAMATQPSNVSPPGTILKVYQKGYVLHERLVRPARVVVAKAEA